MIGVVGDITKLHDVDIIVNAANGIGVMGAGVAGAIARSMGEIAAKQVREYCKEHGPFEAGTVYRTDAGLLKRLGYKEIYHAVTMKYPGTPTSLTIISNALRVTASEAMIEGVRSIAFPGLGTGIGGLNRTLVAQGMAAILRPYRGQMDITVIDRNKDFIEAFNEAIGEKNGTPHTTDAGTK